MAHYESHIGRLSQGVIDARNQAMELQKVLKDVGDQEEMEELRRQIALYKGKEERLENRVADLEVQVDRRTLQCQSAERRMAEAQEQAGALETQLEELR